MTGDGLRHVDPSGEACPLTLREAVVEGVVRRAHDRLTGRGQHGATLFGDAPSRLLAAGFLLPARRQAATDTPSGPENDATSPIHLSSIGMSFQIERATDGEITVVPQGAVYVRVLPSADDLRIHPVPFGLDPEVRRDLRARKRAILRRLCEAEGIPERGATQEQRNRIAELRVEAARSARADWARSVRLPAAAAERAGQDTVLVGDEAAVAAEVNRGIGADPALESTVGMSDEVAAAAATEGEANATEEQGDSETRVWDVSPDLSLGAAPPDHLVSPAEIPHKWRRLEVDWPALRLDPRANAEALAATSSTYAAQLSETLRARILQWLQDADPEQGGQAWAMPRATDAQPWHKVRPSDVVDWEATLRRLRAATGPRATPDIDLRLEASIVEDPLDPTASTVRVMLTNRSRVVNLSRVPDKLLDRGLYLAGLKVGLSPRLHRNHQLEWVQPSYRWNRWLLHPALGINCGVDRLPGNPENGVVLVTNPQPTWRQPRIVPYALDSEPAFEIMARRDGGLPITRELVAAYDQWIAATEAARPWRIPSDQRYDANVEARERQQFEDDVADWRAELDRIRLGVKVLEQSLVALEGGAAETDPSVAPLTAWRATNAAFARSAELGSPARKWHLFQLAFMLAHLPGAASRIPTWAARGDLFSEGWLEGDDGTVSLLYFPTGGGKSEAFFGLLVLQSFIDRLRGKARGVTGIVRYPLRLLTAQQANRFARLYAMAELERQNLHIAGDPFQIGFWVGGGNTPNGPFAEGFADLPEWRDADMTAEHEARLRREDPGYKSVRRWVRLTECPFCKAKLIAIRQRNEGGAKRLAHACVDRSCSWNAQYGRIEPLPFHVMDSDIYAYAPTVLLGTVDKMAVIGHNPATIARMFGMLGFAPWLREDRDDRGIPRPGHGRLGHPRRPNRQGAGDRWQDATANGCVEIGPVYGNRRVELFDPYPALEIQDEAHLLEQSLGTFSGLFGSLLEAALANLAPRLGDTLTSRYSSGRVRRSKVVAASATVQGPERQIEMLYQRRVAMFPRPGHDLYQSFFARLQEPEASDDARRALDNPEDRAPTRRLYVSMPTNGRPHTSATVAVLSNVHLTLSELYAWVTGSPQNALLAQQALVEALPDGPLHASHEAAIRAASRGGLMEAIDLARIVLVYVTNKKGGDSLQAAIGEFVPRDHERAGVSLGANGGVETGLITGSIEMERIQDIVDQAKVTWKPGDLIDPQKDFLGALRGIVATSAISHGVDIERLNTMLFAGLPSDIAEYVQASSRVGRTHVGVSILVPTPQRPRDTHVVGIHDVFHRFLERMVQPAAVDRWGEQAIERVLTSALQTKVCAVDHFNRLCAARTNADRTRLWDSSGVPALADRLLYHFVDLQREIAQFLCRAVGIDLDDGQRAAYAPTAHPWYRQMLNNQARGILEDMRSEEWRAAALRAFFSSTGRSMPMMSLRDIDDPGQLTAAGRSIVAGRVLRRERVGELMRLLRRGDGRWDGTEEAGDEESPR